MKMANIPIRDLHHLDLSMHVSGWSPCSAAGMMPERLSWAEVSFVPPVPRRIS